MESSSQYSAGISGSEDFNQTLDIFWQNSLNDSQCAEAMQNNHLIDTEFNHSFEEG